MDIENASASFLFSHRHSAHVGLSADVSTFTITSPHPSFVLMFVSGLQGVSKLELVEEYCRLYQNQARGFRATFAHLIPLATGIEETSQTSPKPVLAWSDSGCR